jgi:hypothetical protein
MQNRKSQIDEHADFIVLDPNDLHFAPGDDEGARLRPRGAHGERRDDCSMATCS